MIDLKSDVQMNHGLLVRTCVGVCMNTEVQNSEKKESLAGLKEKEKLLLSLLWMNKLPQIIDVLESLFNRPVKCEEWKGILF